MSSLDLTLLYLLAAVIGVVACRFLKLPPMLGYLVVGVLIANFIIDIVYVLIDPRTRVQMTGGSS